MDIEIPGAFILQWNSGTGHAYELEVIGTAARVPSLQ